MTDIGAKGLTTAWAIVRPYPQKEKLLVWQLERQAVEVYRPMSLRPRRPAPHLPETLCATPVFPGYLFARPTGAKGVLVDQEYIADILRLVVFDEVVSSLRDYYEAAASHDQAVHLAKIRARASRGARRIYKSFADIGRVIDEEVVDTNRIDALFKAIRSDSAALVAHFDRYIEY